MYKVLLFDIDGVLLIHKKLFIDEISKTLNENAYSALHDFNDGRINVLCDEGKKDPLVEIKPYLDRAGWKYSVDEYLKQEYLFEQEGIDYNLLDMISQINKKKIKCFIGSNQNYHRKAFLIEKMKIDEIVAEAYFSCDFGISKPNRMYWEKAFGKMNAKLPSLNTKEILFFDDRKDNIDSAKEYGFSVKHVISKKDIEEELIGILS